MDFGAALTDMWRAILLIVPKAVGFVAILLIGFVVARLLRKGMKRLLERFGFDRAVQRGGMSRFLVGGRYEASDIVAMLAYYTVLLFTLQLAFGIWGPNPVSDLISAVVAWLPSAIVAIIIVVVAAALASAVRNVITSMLSSLSYGRLLANLAAIFIVGLGVIAALNQIGVATTVTTPVLITVLATIGGILVVGVGGGMVRPMQQRWERWLSKAEDESGTVREKIHAYAETRREAMEAEAAARREAESAPAVGTQPMGTTFAPGKASVGTAPIYPPPVQGRPDAPTVPAHANPLNQRNDWPTERRAPGAGPDQPNGWPVWGETDQRHDGRAEPLPEQRVGMPADAQPDHADGRLAEAHPEQADGRLAEAQPEQRESRLAEAQPDQRESRLAEAQPDQRESRPAQAQAEHQAEDQPSDRGAGAQPVQRDAKPARSRPKQSQSRSAKAQPGRRNDGSAQTQVVESDERMDWPAESRPDSPTLPVRASAPGQRPSVDPPTQILRPIDPDEHR